MSTLSDYRGREHWSYSSINQFISTAVAEKLSAMLTEEYLSERAKRGSRKRFRAVLAKVKDVPAEPHDAL